MIVINAIQEAYNLIGDLKVGKMETEEGIHINILSNTDQMSIEKITKRETTVAEAVESLYSETNSKLQYLTTTTLTPMRDTIDSLCRGMGIHDNIISTLISSDPNSFLRWLLGEEYLTAEIVDEIILYWPCKKIESWYPGGNGSACYIDLPVSFLNDKEWVQGYINTRTGDIESTSPKINCTHCIHWYKIGQKHYKMHAGIISLIQTETINQSPMRTRNSTVKEIFLPKWNNEWVYNSSMFIRADKITSLAETGETRYTTLVNYMAHTTSTDQLRYMQLIFTGAALAHVAFNEEPQKTREIITSPMPSHLRQSYLLYIWGKRPLNSPKSKGSWISHFE